DALQRRAVALQRLEPAVEHDAIADGDREQHGDEPLGQDGDPLVHHGMSFLGWADSKTASVVRERRSGWATCTATASPARPIRAWVRTTSPQRRSTRESGLTSSIRVSPTARSIIRFSGIWRS